MSVSVCGCMCACVSVCVCFNHASRNERRKACDSSKCSWIFQECHGLLHFFLKFFYPPHGVFFPTQIVFLGYFLKKNGNFSVSTQRIPTNFISPQSRIPPESRDIKILQIGCKLPPQDALLPPKIVTKKSSDRDSNSGPLESQSKT